MDHMFYKCGKIEELPDISFWDTKNVTNFSNMVTYCKSLKSFPPNHSRWKLTNAILLNNMFIIMVLLNHMILVSLYIVSQLHIYLILINGIQKMLKI